MEGLEGDFRHLLGFMVELAVHLFGQAMRAVDEVPM
jgi:hypothetical protein